MMRTRNRRPLGLLVVAAACWFGAGCASVPRVTLKPERYRLDVNLDPATHRLVARAAIDVTRIGEPIADQPVGFEILLHPDLEITNVRVSGAHVRPWLWNRLDSGGAPDSPSLDESQPARHPVLVDRPFKSATVFVEYEGALFQDVAAGERPGEIHNFEMRAHIGEDGTYLAGGYWYPHFPSHDHEGAVAPDSGTEETLADYTLTVNTVPGFAFTASGESDSRLAAQTGRATWRSPYRLTGLTLVGGKHRVHTREHNGVAIALHLKPEQSSHVEGLFAAVQRNLDRYEPLIGEYPAREYRIVDNFFSSGFAFPTFTLLSSAVIDMGERSQSTHGYLDHEMLHSWWGNGIHVAPADGNWCEALASFGANYYGFVLDGDVNEARRKRRNFSHFLSRLKPEDDKPLGTFGKDGGCSRSIAYDKGAMVFHMLAWTMGQEADSTVNPAGPFWTAMRQLTNEYVGKFASWEDIRRVCEAQSGKDLRMFFAQWVRRGGAPLLKVETAEFNSAEQVLDVTLSQGEPAFDLQVPLRINYADRHEDVMVPFAKSRDTRTLPVNGVPVSVELDPDYHLFRKVPPELIVPTTASTRYGTAFTSAVPAGDVPEAYKKIQASFASSFESSEKTERTAGSLTGDDLAERCVLILGAAALDPYVAAFLSAVEFPVRFQPGSFVLDGVTYSASDEAILATAAHPGVKGGGITVVFANSEKAIPSAIAIPMYDRSIVIFKSGRATVKKDLEQYATVPVSRE